MADPDAQESRPRRRSPSYMPAERFAGALQELGWTQIQAAEMLGYRRWAVSRWCNGHDPIPWAVAKLVDVYLHQPDLVEEPRVLE